MSCSSQFPRPTALFSRTVTMIKPGSTIVTLFLRARTAATSQKSAVLAACVKVTRIWPIISVRMDPQCVKETGVQWRKAIVKAHCTTSADKWAFVSIAINDSKWRSRELLHLQCKAKRTWKNRGSFMRLWRDPSANYWPLESPIITEGTWL